MPGVQCPGCGRVIQMAESELSLTVECAACDTRFPAASARVPDGINASLIPCRSCGHRIAHEATTCPRCGAPNHWTHPRIPRFLADRRRFGDIPNLEADGRGFVLWGRSTRPGTSRTTWRARSGRWASSASACPAS